MNRKHKKLIKLINLLGLPDGEETGFSVSESGRIVHSRTSQKTKYFIGGKTGNQIITLDGERIGNVSSNSVHRIYVEGIKTNYRIGGPTGKRILYVKETSKLAS